MRFITGFLMVLAVSSASAQNPADPTAQFSGRKGKSSASIQFKPIYMDTYMFRGHVYDDEPSFHGDLTLGISSWSYNAYYVSPREEEGIGEQEVNHTVSFTMVSGNRITTTGYRFYDYDGTKPDTQEFFYRITHQRRWSLTYGVAYDFDTYKGYYFDFALSRAYQVSTKSFMVFNLNAGLSYDMDEKRTTGRQISEPGFFEGDGFNHAYAHLSYHYAITSKIEFETGMEYHYADDDLLVNPELGIDKDNTVWRTAFTIKIP